MDPVQTGAATVTTPAPTATEPQATQTPAPAATPATDATQEPTKVEPAAPAATQTPEPTPAAPATVVPEKYELKQAEGSLLTAAQVSEVEAFAKANKFSNEQAQTLLTAQESAVANHHQAMINQHQANVTSWSEAIKNDPVLGGENYNRTLEQSKRALDYFGSAELASGLEQTGFVHHPDFVRFVAKIGAAMGEGGKFLTNSNPAAPIKKSAADILYDKSSKK